MGKIIHEVVFDIPRQHYQSYRNLHELVILKQELFYDYRTGPPSYERLYQDTIRWIEDYPYERLKRGTEACNGPLMLELCLRHFADCEVPSEEQPYDPSYLTELLEDIAAANDVPLTTRPNRKTRVIKHQTPVLQQRALAACAWIEFRSHFALPEGGSLYAIKNERLMRDAASTANVAASIDFVPTIVIRIANWLHTLKTRYGGLEVRTMPVFRENQSLWRAWEAYRKRCLKIQIAEWFKIRAASNVYWCDGCDVQAMHKNAFRTCGGKCPPEKKPHYCSRECQQKH
ncbi:hypothetical protein OH76DRAFT_1173522 [Lentinus brumalis]|uniref:MYND-type domain-containing protein n=1 Tax=Lentinus brumalis TaxID=2498619 RepID=A0A371CUC9_9APHY|nr:hypothetical protein OH76DRAFT_1173522 [Polyporus brumalis]